MHRIASQQWSMYPGLHEQVTKVLEEDGLYFAFHEADEDRGSVREYDTNIMGRFECHNSACPTNRWSSKKIAVTIRMYTGHKYNVRVYHQQCRNCRTFSKPNLDGSYAERVTYRLRKWNGVDVIAPPFSEYDGPAHERDLCAGCQNGHCRQQEWA